MPAEGLHGSWELAVKAGSLDAGMSGALRLADICWRRGCADSASTINADSPTLQVKPGRLFR